MCLAGRPGRDDENIPVRTVLERVSQNSSIAEWVLPWERRRPRLMLHSFCYRNVEPAVLRSEGPVRNRPDCKVGIEGKIKRAPKARYNRCRTFGAHIKQNAYPDLTVGPTLYRFFEAPRMAWRQNYAALAEDGV